MFRKHRQNKSKAVYILYIGKVLLFRRYFIGKKQTSLMYTQCPNCMCYIYNYMYVCNCPCSVSLTIFLDLASKICVRLKTYKAPIPCWTWWTINTGESLLRATTMMTKVSRLLKVFQNLKFFNLQKLMIYSK